MPDTCHWLPCVWYVISDVNIHKGLLVELSSHGCEGQGGHTSKTPRQIGMATANSSPSLFARITATTVDESSRRTTKRSYRCGDIAATDAPVAASALMKNYGI